MFSYFKMFVLFVMMTIMTPLSVQANDDLQSVIDKYCRKDCVSAEKLIDVAYRAAKAYRLDMNAVLAIIHVESKYHIKAKNGSSIGLTQVLLRFHKPKFRGKNYYDVEDNMFAGMKVLSDCVIRMKGNYDAAFGCYNGGGDKNYKLKANKALKMIRGLNITPTQFDPLGVFIARLG